MFRLPAGMVFSAVMLLVISGCNTEPTDTASYAYIAPTSINLRPTLTDRSTSVAVLNHGERVQVLEVRRRFAKIRSSKGAEGWIDAMQLLTPDQMAEIRRAEAHALKLPSEGSATVFEALNVHIEPSRQSPAFTKIPESGSVEVLGHRLEPKVTGPPKVPVFTLPANPVAVARKQRKERQARNSFRLPSRPPAPKAPDNWLDLSTARVTATPPPAPEQKAPPQKSEDAKKPVPMEDWTLVRTKDKKCGWVLSRNLTMSIPDEVAQYAEGKRITSYFDLGVVQDEAKGPKHNWLWTTSSELEQFDFDSWRVFLWNRRRHRYETSYRERDLEGYFPVHVDTPEGSRPERTFELILRQADGKLEQRRYFFDGLRVHLVGRQGYDPAKSMQSGDSPAEKLPPQTGSKGKNWLRRKWSDFRKGAGGA
jgi:hypothetical protein